jgi:hypothetical protein
MYMILQIISVLPLSCIFSISSILVCNVVLLLSQQIQNSFVWVLWNIIVTVLFCLLLQLIGTLFRELVTSHATDSITVATKVVIPYEIQQDVCQMYEQQFINIQSP